MTEQEIAELERLERAATPQPWRPLGDHWCGIENAYRVEVVTWGHDEGGFACEQDGRFTVAARNALPRLLEERRRLLEALREAREAVLCGTLPLSADDAIAFAEEESK